MHKRGMIRKTRSLWVGPASRYSSMAVVARQVAMAKTDRHLWRDVEANHPIFPPSFGQCTT